MSKSLKGFVVGPAAPSKKCGTIYAVKTKLEKLEKKKLKLEKQIEKQIKKKEKKKEKDMVVAEQQAASGENKSSISLTAAMIQATTGQLQVSV